MIELICEELKKGELMKQSIHPEYKEVEVKCACGNTFTTKSTKSDIKVEICSECHPFFTGAVKNIERGGRAERFREKYNMK